MLELENHSEQRAGSILDSSVNTDLADVAAMPLPQWSSERNFGVAGEAYRRARRAFTRYGRFRGNKTAYLRHLGLRVGENCSLVNGVLDYGEEPWLIEIGNRVSVARGVVFITHDGTSRVFRHLVPQGNAKYGNGFAPIRVLDNSVIGLNAVILPGVTIGPNSIIGAGSVITRDVPPSTVAAGNPARIVSTLAGHIERYTAGMLAIDATEREALRRELTEHFFGEVR